MALIETTSELQEFCGRMKENAFIAVDTEFMRSTTYWAELSLVQVAGAREARAIDAMAPGVDLQPLFELLADAAVLKVFHAARQDLEIFHQLAGRLPHPIFDTQVAAMVCGYGDQVGYDTLVRELTGHSIDKHSRLLDWSRRPLSKQQIAYALDDVIHLREVYEALRRRLEKSGRESWLNQEMTVLTSPDTYRNDPAEAWQRLKVRSRDPRHLAVVRELAAWRESEAQRRNIPRNRVLRDDQLLDIAARRPGKETELAKTRGFSADHASGRMGREILTVVRRGLDTPPIERPRAPSAPAQVRVDGALISLIKVLLKLKCDEHNVAQKLVASAGDIEKIAADDDADVPALAGWRREIFGDAALALKHGRLALAADGDKVSLIDLAGRADNEDTSGSSQRISS